MPNPLFDRRSWHFLRLPKVWVWKTEQGYLVGLDDQRGRHIVICRTPAYSAEVAIQAKVVGHPEPIPIANLLRSCRTIGDEGFEGLVWVDGGAPEYYSTTEFTAGAIVLPLGRAI